MNKGRYLKSAERACAGKARFDTPHEAERTSEYRFGAYRCPVCHHFHLTSRARSASVAPPEPPKVEPKGPKLGDLDWSAALDPEKPRPARPAKVVRPRPAPLPPPLPLRTAKCIAPAGKDGRVLIVLDGRIVKTAKVTDPGLRKRLIAGDKVSISPTGMPPTVVARLDA